MTKNVFYKIIKGVKNGYRTEYLDIPQVEHNINESLIVNVDDLHYKTLTTETSIFRSTYAYVTEEIFVNVIAPKLIFPSVTIPNFGAQYLGAIIVRCERGDILTYITRPTNNTIYLRPATTFEINPYKSYNTTDILPKRNIKIFLTKEEFDADYKSKKEKSEARRKKDRELTKNLTKQAPVFSFVTPKFKVLEVIKDTAYLPNVKVGDIVYAEIPVIKETDDRKFGSMHGIGTRTNWISIFINDNKVKEISPVTFPSLFFNNIIAEEIK